MAHFSVVSLTRMVLLLVLICWTTSSTGAAFSLEEEFLQLKENYIEMKQVMKSLEAKVEQLKSFESTAIELQAKVTQLEAKIEQQDSLLTSLLREKNERTAATDFNSVSINNNQSAVFINGMPSSCGDLKLIGHTLSGLYSVMGSAAKIESVFCDFSQTPENFQKWIGYTDDKSTPVHFYVQRSSSFSTKFTPIPFDLARVNEGNAMDLASGKFTAPRPGIYFFSFAGRAFLNSNNNAWLGIYLYLNGNLIGSSLVQEVIGTSVNQDSPLSLQSTLNLKTGDQLWVEIDYCCSSFIMYLYDDGGHFTHFTGFMLEEEIAASL